MKSLTAEYRLPENLSPEAQKFEDWYHNGSDEIDFHDGHGVQPFPRVFNAPERFLEEMLKLSAEEFKVWQECQKAIEAERRTYMAKEERFADDEIPF